MDEARVRFPASAIQFFLKVLVAQLADRPLHTRKALGSIPSENFSNLNRYAGGRGIDTPILQSGELAQMVERPLSIRCYSSEVELSAAVRMVGGSIPPDTFSSFFFRWGLSSNGRAVDSHSTGRGIDAPILHSKTGN